MDRRPDASSSTKRDAKSSQKPKRQRKKPKNRANNQPAQQQKSPSFNGVGREIPVSPSMSEAVASALENPPRPDMHSEAEDEAANHQHHSSTPRQQTTFTALNLDKNDAETSQVRKARGEESDDAEEEEINDEDTSSDRETGHNSATEENVSAADDDDDETASFHTAGNTSQVVSPATDFATPHDDGFGGAAHNKNKYREFDDDRRSVASTIKNVVQLSNQTLIDDANGKTFEKHPALNNTIVGDDAAAVAVNFKRQISDDNSNEDDEYEPVSTSTPKSSRRFAPAAAGDGDGGGDAEYIEYDINAASSNNISNGRGGFTRLSSSSTTTPPPSQSVADYNNPAHPMYHSSPYRSGDILNDTFDEEDVDTDDYARAAEQREYDEAAATMNESMQLSQENNSQFYSSPPRNFYDAALRGEYSNNYGEQSMLVASNPDNINISFSSPPSADISPTTDTAASSTPIHDYRTKFNNSALSMRRDESDDLIFATAAVGACDVAADEKELSSFISPIDYKDDALKTEMFGSDFKLDELMAGMALRDEEYGNSNADNVVVESRGAEEFPSPVNYPSQQQQQYPNSSAEQSPIRQQEVRDSPVENYNANEKVDKNVSDELPKHAIDNASSSKKTTQTLPEPQQQPPHEWIDIFASGELIRKILRDAPNSSESSPAHAQYGGPTAAAGRPQHRNRCLISYEGYKVLGGDKAAVIKTTDLDAETLPESLFVKFVSVSAKQIVVSEADDIQAIDLLVRMMRCGEKVRALVKPRFAYGERGYAERGVPGSTTLVYDLELLSILPDAVPEKAVEYENKPNQLLRLAEEKKQAGNLWFGMQLYISAATAWQAGIHYGDVALAAIPNYLLNLPGSVESAEQQCQQLREQISTLLSLLHSNMSLVQLKQTAYEACLRSCDEALRYKQGMLKCLVRKGKVLGLLDRHDEAVKVLQAAKIKVEEEKANTRDEVLEKEIKDLLAKSSSKAAQQTRQEQDMFKRMMGGLSPETSRRRKSNDAVAAASSSNNVVNGRRLLSGKRTKNNKRLNDAAAEVLLATKDVDAEPGSIREFFSRHRNAVVAGSFVAITVGVIAGAYFLKQSSMMKRG